MIGKNIYTNGNGASNGNGNGNNGFSKLPFSFLTRLFNIAPSQWGRVSECWLITFFFKIGSALGWTILTAVFVAQFGIAFLPTLFVLNAVLIMLSTFYFEQLIMRIKREVLMILMVLIAAVCLFFAAIVYDKSLMAFFALVIFAESVFLAQFNVFIPILVGDRFTPLESQSTFPFIESADTIGGMIGGTLVGILAAKVPIQIFLYIWIALLACVIFAFVITNYLTCSIPPLPVRASRSKTTLQKKDQIKLVFKSMKQMPFLKGLVVIVLLQWVFMNILEFQYTKAIEQTIRKAPEATIAKVVDTQILKADVIGGQTAFAAQPVENPAVDKRVLSVSEQTSLAEKLGMFTGLFHAAALIVQILVASRLITSLGIVGSMIFHPVIMLMSLVGMFLKFGFRSSVIAKFSFSTTNVIHKNAYFSSHYAFPKSIRDQAAEFLEGIVRPMGTILGMFFILLLQFFLTGRDLSMWIHIIMFLIMAAVLVETIRLQPKYTRVTRDQLFSSLPYPEKINAIEILSQHGHKDVTNILIQKLNEISKDSSEEATVVRIKLLSALGHARDYQALPEILESLYDKSPDVRFEAAHALMGFSDIGEKFYFQAFSRFRMIETLKEVFRAEESSSVRSAIIRVFSLIRQPDTVSFLLEMLSSPDNYVKADCIYTLGLFRDPNIAYYILPFLHDSDSIVRANVIIALWQFPKYGNLLDRELNIMLQSADEKEMKAALFAIGEIGVNKKRLLHELLYNGTPDIQLEAAFALTKMGDQIGFNALLQRFLYVPKERFDVLGRFFNRLRPKTKKMAERVLVHFIASHIHDIMHEYGDARSLHEVDDAMLEKLRRMYKLLDQHEELYAIENAIGRRHAGASAV